MTCVVTWMVRGAQERAVWFTTMVGKKGTLRRAREALHALPAAPAVRTTEFVQGRTSRWGLAWSYAAAGRAAAALPLPRPPAAARALPKCVSPPPSSPVLTAKPCCCPPSVSHLHCSIWQCS